MTTKIAQGWFYPFMKSITQIMLSQLKNTSKNIIKFLSKRAQCVNPHKDKKEVV